MDVELPPRQETTVPVRVSHRNRRDLPFISVTESLKIPNLSKVYSGRSVLPARFSNLQICVANTDDRPQLLKKGTRLGNIESADIVGPASPEPITPATVEPAKESIEATKVIEDIMKSLPTELTDYQRQQARQLIERNESIFSKSEYDIGRTPLCNEVHLNYVNSHITLALSRLD